MMTKRQQYIYQLIGKITNLEQKKIYSKNKPEYYGQLYYKLAILTPEQRIKDLYVFANLLNNQQIWPKIEQAECLNKPYLFFYQRGRMNAILLVDWKELEHEN